MSDRNKQRRDQTDAHPLRWPDGWKKTGAYSRGDGYQFQSGSAFEDDGKGGKNYVGKRQVTYGPARESLVAELARIGAKAVVISSNLSPRAAGDARGKISEPGVALYFDLKGRPIVMAQDAFDNVAANIRSLALAIDAMRSLERHGGGSMMARAFDGFAALPPPAGAKPKRPWWQVLRFPDAVEDRELLSVSEVEARFRTLAKRLHPDLNPGADDEGMQELNEALAEARKELEP